MSTLVIVGNGFDLYCKLNSRYVNFYDWLRKDETRKNNNLWSIHFASHPREDLLWMGVEDLILQAISGRKPDVEKWADDARACFGMMTRLTKSEEARYLKRCMVSADDVFDAY